MSRQKDGPKNWSNPFGPLQPLVVRRTTDYAVEVLLGVTTFSLDQVAAGISFLNELTKTEEGNFKLDEWTPGQTPRLHGRTGSEYAGKAYERLARAIKATYRFSGSLEIEVVRYNRRKIGVDATVKLGNYYGARTQLPSSEKTPPQVEALIHEKEQVTFSLRQPNRSDERLIKDALAVAAQLGVYIEQLPTTVFDRDRRASLHREFDYVEPAS